MKRFSTNIWPHKLAVYFYVAHVEINEGTVELIITWI